MKLGDIGDTPLVEVKSDSGNRVFSKCEFMNPSGSHKDRTYLSIITKLEASGVIQPGMILVDSSTGNGGAALAWIGREKGYSIRVFMPEGMTQERKAQILSYGAQITETPKEEFLAGAATMAKKFSSEALEGNTYFLDQSNTLLNKEAWHGCGEEIVNALKKMNVIPDFFICSIGTGGTFSGIAEVLKRECKEIKAIGIEVKSSAPLYAMKKNTAFKHRPHNLMGLGAGVLSINTIPELVHEVRLVDGARSWQRMKQFIVDSGIQIGPTCGANLLVCDEIIRECNNQNIVTLFFDSAWKYRSRWDGIYPEYRED